MTRPSFHLFGAWDANQLVLMSVAAVLVPVSVAFSERGLGLLLPLVLAAGIAVFWHFVFSRMRRRPMAWDGLVTALVFVVMVPSAPLWQQGLALSFGLVMGDLIFGGRGRGFLSPASVSLAFLLYSFPQTATATFGIGVTIAAMTSGVLLLAVGMLSWRVAAGFFVGMLTLAMLWSMPEGWSMFPEATLILGVVFLVGDPVAAACTNVGRWAYGILTGALVVLLGHEGGGVLASVVFAALMASIFAPLIDQAVIWANIRRRARRQHDA